MVCAEHQPTVAACPSEHADQALLCRRLTRIALDIAVADTADALSRRAGDASAIDDLCERIRFGPLTRTRLRALI